MARRRRGGTTRHRSDCLAAERRASAVNLGTVSDTRDAIFVSGLVWGLMARLWRVLGMVGFKDWAVGIDPNKVSLRILARPEM